MIKKIGRLFLCAVMVAALVAGALSLTAPTAKATTKSLYVIADLGTNPTPIKAYSIQAAPNYLVYQTTNGVPRYALGAVGLTIDTDSAMLFITYESSNRIQLVDATTMADEGYIDAPNASNLAGIVVDQDNQKVYTVDRSTNHLYVYSWNAATKTLTNDVTTSPYYISLAGVSSAHGLALDELNDLLYVGDMVATNNIRVFSIADWSSAANYTVSQPVQGIAVDVTNGFVYTGHAGWPDYGTKNLLCKLDIATNTETNVDIRTLTTSVYDDSVVGLAVDPYTSLLYITTGNQGSEGRVYDDTDQIMVFDSDLNLLHATLEDIGDPTGLCIPGKAVSYNPLNLQKSDGLADDECVMLGDSITYTISYDNQNPSDVTGVTITDTLPAEVSYVSSTGGGTYSAGPPEIVSWDIGTLTQGESGSVTLTVQVKLSVTPGTTISNNVSIDCDQTGPGYADEETLVCPNLPPVADPNGPYLGAAGSPITFDGTGSSDPDGDPLTYDWDWGDGNTSSDAGPTPSHSYAEAGIYDVCLTVSDGIESDIACTIAVVYDSDAGFVTGGGWIDSPAGAYTADPALTGRANFGFVSKYNKGASTPTGQTEFQFQVGSLNFHSSSYDWLVITGSDYAMFKGLGTINSEGEYKFMIWAGDDDSDTFRIKIWEEDEYGIETVVYDNGADQPIDGGQIVIHTK